MSLVITGSPGVGKHTVAGTLAQKMNLEVVDINQVAIDSGLDCSGVDTGVLEGLLAQKIPSRSVIVGHLAPYVLKKSQTDVAIVLRRNPYELLSVYRQRSYPNAKLLDNVGSEILGIIAHDARRRFLEKTVQVDSSCREFDGTIKKIQAVVRGDRQDDAVDWLGLVYKNNDHAKFFAGQQDNYT